MTAQGKGKSTKEILKRIDYIGSLSLYAIGKILSIIYSPQARRSILTGSKVGATLVFLSVRYSGK